jgi:glycosyltransferase involved in cell wall biosynthesis
MERRKGSHLFAAIVRSVLGTHNAAFVFAGEDLFGHMKQLLEEVSNFGTRGSVHYVGKLPPDEPRSFIRVADIMMLPSLSANCPYSCLEAMAAGWASVASDQGDLPELIRHGHNGLLATTGQTAIQIHMSRGVPWKSMQTAWSVRPGWEGIGAVMQRNSRTIPISVVFDRVGNIK